MPKMKRITSLWSLSWSSWFLSAHPIALLTHCFLPQAKWASLHQTRKTHWSHSYSNWWLLKVYYMPNTNLSSLSSVLSPTLWLALFIYSYFYKHFFFRLGSWGIKKLMGFSMVIDQINVWVGFGTEIFSCWKYQSVSLSLSYVPVIIPSTISVLCYLTLTWFKFSPYTHQMSKPKEFALW